MAGRVLLSTMLVPKSEELVANPYRQGGKEGASAFFERWRAAQEDPDGVPSALAGTDPAAKVSGSQHDLAIELVATTSLSGTAFKHRLRLLAGSGWELRDVRAG